MTLYPIEALLALNYPNKLHQTKEITQRPFRATMYCNRIYGNFYTSAMLFLQSGRRTTLKNSLKLTKRAEALFGSLRVSIFSDMVGFGMYRLKILSRTRSSKRFELACPVLMLEVRGLGALFRSLFAEDNRLIFRLPECDFRNQGIKIPQILGPRINHKTYSSGETCKRNFLSH